MGTKRNVVGSPAPITKVERKILTCVAAGEVADFSGTLPRGRKPSVSAAFLRELWLELVGERKIHPRGIHLRGLRIVGSLDVSGVSRPASDRDRLCLLSAKECDFEGALVIVGASMEGLQIVKCRFQGSMTAFDDSEPFAIAGDAADIAGGCQLTEIVADATIQFSRARIGSGFFLENSRDLPNLGLAAARIDGPALIYNCSFGAKAGTIGVNLNSACIEGPLFIKRCDMRGGLVMNHLRAAGIDMQRASFGNFWLNVARLGQLLIRKVSVGEASIESCKIEGSLVIDRLFVRPGGEGASLAIVATEVGGGIAIGRSHVNGPFNLRHTRALQVQIWSTKITGSPQAMLDLSMATTGDFSLANVKIDGGVHLTGTRMSGDFSVRASRIGARLSGTALGPTLTTADGPDIQETNRASAAPFGADAINFANTCVTGDAEISDCAIDGTLYARNLDVGGSLILNHVWVEGRLGRWSLELYGVKCGIAGFQRCHLTGGAAFPLMRCAELQIKSCTIDSSQDARSYGQAIWASDLHVERLVLLSAVLPEQAGVPIRINRISGRIDFSSSKIGQDFSLASTICTLPRGHTHGRLGVALNLSSVTIGGDCRLADRSFDQMEWRERHDVPAEIEGCVKLDDAVIEGDLNLHRTILKADGQVKRPGTSFSSDERVSKRKRGVALSLRDARVAGEFELGKPKIQGLIDMRGATIGLLADGGGKRWCPTGLAPGHLLLDGLTYRRLDDIEDEADGGGPNRIIGNISVAAERRLDWLKLQFTDRRPDAESFAPQPYEQLARVFVDEGNERARRRVVIAKRDMQRRHGRLGRFERSIGWLLKQTSDYGYSPIRAALALMLFIAVGTSAAVEIEAYGGFVLTNADSAPANHLNPLAYAIDSALPIIDLKQDSMFTVDAAKLPGFWNNAGLVTVLHSFYELLGLVLVSITVLTFTGTLREKE